MKCGPKESAVVPGWAAYVLQGLAFWLGYQRSYFRHHALREGSITAERCSLLSRKINVDRASRALRAEVPYRDLDPGLSLAGVGRQRVDLLISRVAAHMQPSSGGHSTNAEMAIEVNRGSVSTFDGNKDLLRLSRLRTARPEIQTFLLLVGQASLPRQHHWFQEDRSVLRANRRYLTVRPSDDAEMVRFKVRRLCKAIATTRPTVFHTAMLVEVR